MIIFAQLLFIGQLEGRGDDCLMTETPADNTIYARYYAACVQSGKH